ncbi:microtubule organization protein AKNA isoform X2 [Scyliorhinus torazame]|uniref:microtubule organization protein AKNA isoform X2 n=1 Tax=Scyliorhinus torazame TaxID=75743 RepID=UPI003B5CF9D9
MAVAETQVVDSDLDPDEDLEGQDEDIFNQMDENGIIGMDEINEYYLHYHPRLEDGLETVEEVGEMTEHKVLHDYNKLRSLVHPQEPVDDDSFDISEFQDSDPVLLSMSAEDDASLSHLIYDSEPQEEDGILSRQDSKSHWRPERDHQLDMTEDEKEQASFLLRNEVGTSKEEDSIEEYSDLPYDEQTEEAIPSLLRDPWCRYEVHNNAQSILDRGDDFSVPSIRDHADKLSDQSDESTNCSKTQGKDPNLLAQDCYSEDFEATYSKKLDVLELSQNDKALASAGEVRKAKQDDPSFNYTMLHFNQDLLRHLSAEDLASGPDIVAETIPDSSCTDSVEESVGRFSNKGKGLTKGNQDSGSANERQKDKSTRSELSRPASNKQVKLTHQQKYPYTLGKPHVLNDNSTGQNSKANRQIKTLTPQKTALNVRASRSNSSKPLSRKITSETSMYGRGRLNYPLPDFSKVEPRVKFPKDEQAYQRPRTKPALSRGNRNDSRFLLHSPAEIVRQVLQSSNECSLITATPPGINVVGEFKSPQQATEMVYQLQEDYRRLLTKYAEAENTIDRLRIGAKVNLYADPPKPSLGVQMASLKQGSKVMMFTIPRAQKAEIGPHPNSNVQTEYHPVADSHEAIEVASTSDGTLASTHSTSIVEPTAGECLTWALAQQAEALQKQMDVFDGLLQARKVAPVAQQKALQRLKEGQDTLERGYLQAREEYRGLQLKDNGSNSYIIGEFDHNREVEGNIFRLGMHLEDLKERIDQHPENHSSVDHWSGMTLIHNSWGTPVPVLQTPVPMPIPTAQPPTPALHRPADTAQNPKPESTAPSAALQHEKVDVEVSSVSGESEDGEAIPETLKHKKMQLSDNFDQLLEQCKNIKDLPLSLGLNRMRENPDSPQPPPTAHAQEMGLVDLIQGGGINPPKDGLDKYSSKTPEPNEPIKNEPMPSNAFKESHEAVEREEEFPAVTEIRLLTISPNSKETSVSEKKDLLCQRSLTCVDGIASPEHVPRKALHQTTSVTLECHTACSGTRRENSKCPNHLTPRLLGLVGGSYERIVSPETDSGFVGSESSRLTPAIQTPEHQPTQSRFQSRRETLLKSPCRDDTRANPAWRPQEIHQRGVTEREHPTTVRQNNSMRRDSVAEPSCTSSPQHWTGSVMSHTESEPDVRNSLNAYAKQGYHRSSLTSSPLTFNPKVHYSSNPLSIHSARDEVIEALQMEVSQLKQRLEESLQKSQGDSEENPSPVMPKPQSHLAHQHSPRRKHPLEHLEKMEDQVWNKSPASCSGSKLFPQHKSELEISTESDASSSITHPLAPGISVSQTSKSSSFREGQKRRPVKVKGPYTGADYSLFVPPTAPEESAPGALACPYCRGVRTHMAAPSRNAPVSTSGTKRNSCPACKGSGICNDQKSKVKPEHAAREELPKSSRRSWKLRKQHSVRIAEPPPVLSCTPPPHYVPYSPQVYYSAPACTLASPEQSRFYYSSGYKMVESTPKPSPRRSKGHHSNPSITDDISYFEAFELSDLSCSLDQAIDAARNIKKTTKKMVRALSSDLYKAKAIQECHQLLTH